MCVGMRGMVDAQIDLTRPRASTCTPARSAARVPNPLHAMAALLAGLHDADGRVTLPGFYDKVVPLSDAERELIAPAAVRREGMAGRRRATAGPPAARPGTGRWSGSGPGRPPRSTACGAATPGPAARRSCPATPTPSSRSGWSRTRTRPTSSPALRRVRGGEHTPAGIEATVTPLGPRRAAVPSRRSTRPRCAAGRRAMERAFGREVLFTREGGSGPEADLTDILRRAAGVRRRRPGRGPDPRAEREGRDGAAAQGRRGGGLPVGRARGRRPGSTGSRPR